MNEEITNGIKISVKPYFEGTQSKAGRDFYIFSYKIIIENNSTSPVQLMNRHWEIFDSLNGMKIVDGPGVVGDQPVLEPDEKYTYKSMCVLMSTYGYMAGQYEMVNLETDEYFDVEIPFFELINTPSLN